LKPPTPHLGDTSGITGIFDHCIRLVFTILSFPGHWGMRKLIHCTGHQVEANSELCNVTQTKTLPKTKFCYQIYHQGKKLYKIIKLYRLFQPEFDMLLSKVTICMFCQGFYWVLHDFWDFRVFLVLYWILGGKGRGSSPYFF
jgi:hypothetical protein